jgi:serine/threonine protein kinase
MMNQNAIVRWIKMQEREPLHQEQLAGEMLGRYHLIRCIGRGNTGETWLAQDPRLHRRVAIKMLPSRHQHDHEYAARFEREARVIATLNHPHILPIHDYGERLRADGQVVSYLVMPYIEGGSVETLLSQRSISQEKALALLSQAAEAIDYAHAQHAQHHDIKPANMLLRSDLWLLLADFGIAHIVSGPAPDSQLSNAQDKAMVGTPTSSAYSAPEQAQGQTVAASDLYSLAVVAYQLLTGHLPFPSRQGGASLNLHKMLSPRRWNPALSPSCEEVLRRALARQPEARYPSAHEFVEELARSLAVPTTPGRRLTRRHLLVGAAVTAAIGAGGVWAAASVHHPVLVPTSSASSPPDPDAPTRILRGHQKPAHALAWSPASGSVVLASACNQDSTVKLWNLQSLGNRQTVFNQSTASKDLRRTQLSLAWSPDGSSLALGGTDAQGRPAIAVYRPDLSGLVAGLEQGFSLPVSALNGLAWSTQTLLAALYTTAPDKGQRFSLGLWDTQKPTLQPQPASISGVLAPSEYESTYRCLVASPDGTRLAIGTSQCALVGSSTLAGNNVLWHPASFDPLLGQLSSNAIDQLAWMWINQGGQALLAIIQGNPNTFGGWGDISGSRPTFANFSRQLNNASNFTAIATYPNTQKWLYAAGTQDGKVYLWDQSAGQLPVRILNGGSIKGRIITLAWSPDGAWLAASYDDSNASIAVWGL